jgi:putative tricarboxylic transport membrane protein
MDPVLAFIFFVAIYQAANYGGSITAVAINAPGTPSAVVTAIDGYALTKQGRAKDALTTAVVCSAVGGVFGALVLLFIAAPMAAFGLKFGPCEYFSLAVLGLATVVGFAGKNKCKAAIAILLGLLLSFVGVDLVSGDERFSFGVIDLFDGFSFIPLMIGLFALGEIFSQLEVGLTKQRTTDISNSQSSLGVLDIFFQLKGTIFRSSCIGTAIGVVPGAGATIAAFLSYGQERRRSKEPETFGNGALEGVAASESANSSSVGGALIPLLALGVPGSATDAVLLGALTLHGLAPGPGLFTSSPDLVYGIFVSVFFANLLILLFGLLGNRAWLKVIDIPSTYLFPLVIATCVLGSYTLKNSLFDSWVCIVAGVVGWLLKKGSYQPAAVVLGLVLGDMLETNLRRAVVSEGWLSPLSLDHPLSLVLLGLALLTLFAKTPRTALPDGSSKEVATHD